MTVFRRLTCSFKY